MRYAARVDTTHAEIRDTLRQLGFRVLDTSNSGPTDLLVRRQHRLWLVEAKTPKSKAGRIVKTKKQQQIEDAGFEIVYLRSRDEAIAWATAKEPRCCPG